MQITNSIQIPLAFVNKVSIFFNEKSSEDFVEKFLECNGVKVLGFVNAHAINVAVRNPIFYNDLMSCDFVLRDGVGMEILLSSLGCNPGLNLNGTDFIPKIIRRAVLAKFKVVLLGTEEPYLTRALEVIRNYGGDVALVQHGFHSDQTYLDMLLPLIGENVVVVIGMGMPKQERLSRAIRDRFSASQNGKFLIVNGGAILDFLGGRVRRAPKWLRRLRMEWIFRLCKEPRRLAYRYFVGNLGFLLRTLFIGLYVYISGVKVRCKKEDILIE